LSFLGAGDSAARAFLDARASTTAMVFVNDEHALNAIPVLAKTKLKIPNDLSVVSFDDTDEAVRHSPPLTGISVPRTQMGYWAACVIADAIRNPGIKTTRLVLHTRLNVRGSCNAIK
jgi:LacI family transcriptional regulator